MEEEDYEDEKDLASKQIEITDDFMAESKSMTSKINNSENKRYECADGGVNEAECTTIVHEDINSCMLICNDETLTPPLVINPICDNIRVSKNNERESTESPYFLINNELFMNEINNGNSKNTYSDANVVNNNYIENSCDFEEQIHHIDSNVGNHHDQNQINNGLIELMNMDE